ncbi:DUF1292 domain-containing protein [Bacillus sp. CECT 9360]|uniref:DUF1292 domain-containing protein n=1 Tax=Bacillus sp. CECT 9360 TaxID=2845821 RepID=UPI001E28B3D0|nr:DUF1292 domain-containing protein [Bacillus sp. CECT 9360]CAH0344122.1 hypothetical protein BCI9360_00353 [Bacillus sp. CECT 9360]
MDRIEAGEIFTISDEDEQEHEVEVMGTIVIEDTEYAAVSFVEDIQEESDDIDVFFLKIDSDGDFSAIESDEEFEKVSAAFEEIMEDEE